MVFSDGNPVLLSQQMIAQLPEVQTEVVPVLQFFDAALGHMPSQVTMASMVSSNLTEPQLASALVSSQAFANLYNGGSPLDPNGPVSPTVITDLFINALGHPPSASTLVGFEGLTNEQAFLAFASSDTVSNALTTNVQAYILQVVELASGVISGDTANIVGQNPTTAMHINGV